MHENDFYIHVPNDLDLKFAALATVVQRYVSTKLEVSVAFLFRENQGHGIDGRGAILNVAP